MDSTELLNLIKNDNESETVEYKTGLREAKTIGQYISALGNSALAASIPRAYLIWGVEDRTKRIVGTDFDPYQENYDDGMRKDVYKFPKIAIRELLANALVHQDFTISGMRPMVEIYDNRVVFSNPGVPLIEPLRFLDVPPRSRNPELANILGKFHIMESRGTGIDKAVYSLEKAHMPAIEILSKGTTATQVTIREKRPFKELSITERNQMIYWDASLKYVNDLKINNASIRDTFDLPAKDTSMVSKAITSSIEANLIKPYDANTSKRFMEYIPYWGVSVQNDR